MPTSIPIRPCPRLPALQLSQDQQRLRTSTHLYSSSLKSKSTSSLWKKKKKCSNMQTVYVSQQVRWGFGCQGGQGCAIGPCCRTRAFRLARGRLWSSKKKQHQKQRRRRRHRTTGFHFDLRGGKGTFLLSLQTSRPLTLQQKKKTKNNRTVPRTPVLPGLTDTKPSTRASDRRKTVVTVAWWPWQLVPGGGGRCRPREQERLCPGATPPGTGERGQGGSGEQRGGRRGAGGRQAQVASGLSTGMSPPQPPSPYCWYGGIWGASMISSPSGDKEAKTVMGSTS